MEEKAVSEIIKILTQEGMTYRNVKRILERVQLITMDSSKNFLDGSNAKEVLETPNRYTD